MSTILRAFKFFYNKLIKIILKKVCSVIDEWRLVKHRVPDFWESCHVACVYDGDNLKAL